MRWGRKGTTCFSSGWSDPVIWAHYSEKHYGLCLGFEIPELKADTENDDCGKVDYIQSPLQFSLEDYGEPGSTGGYEIVRRILFTKFKHWEYEHEIRLWVPLTSTGHDLEFLGFGHNLQIAEVVIGARCTVQPSEIMSALGPTTNEVKIITARAAFDKFEMIEDQSLSASF